jgi:hypothetical protein
MSCARARTHTQIRITKTVCYNFLTANFVNSLPCLVKSAYLVRVIEKGKRKLVLCNGSSLVTKGCCSQAYIDRL